MPEVHNLIEFGKLLKGKKRRDFDKKYGNVLNLIEVNVQVEAITTLSQFYDPQFRCFTFSDFQMVPTLEEYEQILGYSFKILSLITTIRDITLLLKWLHHF